MLEEYQTAVQTYAGGTVTVPWTNIYAFETYDKYSVVDQVRSRNFIYHQPHVDPLTCYFSPENMAIQTFPFKGPLMYYIQQNADANVISKLKKSCKYFHKRNPIWICYKLRYISHAANEMNRVKYHRQSIEVRSTALFYPDEDLYITTAIEFSADNIDDLSTFIPRLFKCEAKFVSIFYQDLTVEEFKFLTMNVIDLSLHNVRIFCNSTVLYLEEMLESVPNVQYLE
uniref:Uncharacterized protein n=1 Tax=Panagrolaimus sp. ES5 TaxID=591445 RepID=A0AC34FN79_9BILA